MAETVTVVMNPEAALLKRLADLDREITEKEAMLDPHTKAVTERLYPLRQRVRDEMLAAIEESKNV